MRLDFCITLGAVIGHPTPLASRATLPLQGRVLRTANLLFASDPPSSSVRGYSNARRKPFTTSCACRRRAAFSLSACTHRTGSFFRRGGDPFDRGERRSLVRPVAERLGLRAPA